MPVRLFRLGATASLLGLAALVALAAGPPKPPVAKASPAKPAAAKPVDPKSSTLPATTSSTDRPIDPLDWPNWRGPEQNSISRETGLIDRWDYNDTKNGNVLWKNAELAGISSPIVLGGKLYTIVRDQPDTPLEMEKVVCVDAATGEKIWENKFYVYLSDVPGERVGWSSCVADPTTGRIYALGVCGYFQCLDGDTGKTIWSRSLSEEFGLLSTYGGRTNVPVIHDDKVIISAVTTNWGDLARPAHRFMAFDKATGEMIWFNGTKLAPEDTTYSTPVVTPLAGQAAMVFGSGDGSVWAFQPRTGKSIWSFQLSRRGINVSPVVENDKVVMAHAEENVGFPGMGAIVGIDGRGKGDITKTGELWRAAGMDGKSSPLWVDGRIYSLDDGGKMYIVDATTGEEVCKPAKLIGTIVRSSPVYGDGKIYICSTSAWHVFQPTEKGVKLIHKLRLKEEDEVSGSPAISHGRIYLPTGGAMYCLGTPDAKPAATSQPAPAAESPVEDTQPAQVQVVPFDALIQPGETCQLRAALYNARGQFLKETPAKFSVAGSGEIDDSGKFVAGGGKNHSAAIVTAKVGELEGQARIRIVPPLPWRFDFSDGQVPITWIGARYRHVVRDVDGEKVMVKVTTIPKGTRSQSWMGPTDLHDYTIQADLQGAQTNNKMPDMGLIAQRYTLDLMGASQQLQIRSWTSQIGKRFDKTIKFPWQAGKWYTLKFQASTDGAQAVLKGKVWLRGEPEPSDWTLEAVDELGNLRGSPGMFGNANDSEIMIDNIQVTPNAS
ncbi:MAG TPA: PQQ-binding-like beta-propeller repeat protein [Pirellulales bacterium]